MGGSQVVERHCRPASAFQPVEELSKTGYGHGVGLEIVDPVDDVVEGDRHEALAGGLGLGGRDGRSAGEQQEQQAQPAHRVISSAAGR
jgi:hypothetical protein